MAISTQQPMRPSLKDVLSAIDNSKLLDVAFPLQSSNIGDNQVTRQKLETDIQIQLNELPQFDFGTSSSFNVAANSNALVDVTFGAPKAAAPLVFCILQSTINLTCQLEQVTDVKASVRVYNNTSADANGVIINWLSVSGR